MSYSYHSVCCRSPCMISAVLSARRAITYPLYYIPVWLEKLCRKTAGQGQTCLVVSAEHMQPYPY